jgi:hypothetical protein
MQKFNYFRAKLKKYRLFQLILDIAASFKQQMVD